MAHDTRPRVFCIGLNKTGTSSMHEAFETLGYKSLHFGGVETMALVQRAIDDAEPLLTHIDPVYDAFSDVFGITYHFYLADAQYPGSKFILTVRDLDEWLDSRRRHVEKNQRAQVAGEYDGAFVNVEIETWTSEYVRHDAVARAYFAHRPRDLLVLNLTAGDGWEQLCEFLDQPVPDVPFPWVNRSQE